MGPSAAPAEFAHEHIDRRVGIVGAHVGGPGAQADEGPSAESELANVSPLALAPLSPLARRPSVVAVSKVADVACRPASGPSGLRLVALELKATSRPSADMTPPADAELPPAPGAPSAPLTSVVVSVRSGPRRRPARRRPAVSAARLSTPGAECDDATVAGDPAAVCLAPAAPLGRLASAVDDPCGMTSDGQRKTFTSSLERPWGGEAVDAAARKGA
jgi:hypothetical protein